MPTIIGEAKAKQIEGDKDWSRIAWSVRPESTGMYGDFGRYVMGYAVHNFLSAKKHQLIPKKPIWHQFDDKRAQRWYAESRHWDGRAICLADMTIIGTTIA